MSHRDIAARREEFVRSAVGRPVVFRMAPMGYDQQAVEAYVGADCVGVVPVLDLSLALRAMRGQGGRLRGCIVAAEPYELTAACHVEVLGELVAMASGLEEWSYEGPVMPLPWANKLCYFTEELTGLLESGCAEAPEGFAELLEGLCEVVRYDLSGEGIEARSQLLLLLENPGGREPEGELAAWRREAAARLREVSQRMGGDHWMAELAAWVRGELSTSLEAQLLVARPLALEEMLEAARRLPGSLWELYRQDGVKFLRVLYGLRPTRSELARVFSCVIWVEAHLALVADDSITLSELECRVVALRGEARRSQVIDDMLHLFGEDARWAQHHAAILQKVEAEERARRERERRPMSVKNYVDVHDNGRVGLNE